MKNVVLLLRMAVTAVTQIELLLRVTERVARRIKKRKPTG